RIAEADRERAERSEQQHRQQEEVHGAQLGLTQLVERCRSLRKRVDQLEGNLSQQRQEIEQRQGQVANLEARLCESMAKRLAASSSLAYAFLHKELAERTLARLTEERACKQEERKQLSDHAKSQQQTWQARRQDLHDRELEVNNLRHHLDKLVGRLREDYQIGLQLTAE